MKRNLNKTDDEKKMHEGHRVRLFETVNKVGLQGLSDVQFMELILCYIFPRGDVNPLAHRLLNKFNDVPSVLEAPVDQLKKVKGMGHTSSIKLSKFLDINFEYAMRKMQDQKVISNVAEFLDHLETVLRFRKDEELHVFGLNNLGEILNGEIFGKGTNSKVSIDLIEIMDYARANNVNGLIIVHNHPNGDCVSSEIDNFSFEKLSRCLDGIGYYLKDSYVIGKNGIYSMKNKKIERLFDTVLNLSQFNIENYDNK